MDDENLQKMKSEIFFGIFLSDVTMHFHMPKAIIKFLVDNKGRSKWRDKKWTDRKGDTRRIGLLIRTIRCCPEGGSIHENAQIRHVVRENGH